MTDDLTVLVERTATRWAARLREWPSKTSAVLAELDADGSPVALALKAALAARMR
jgi:hypothetical protein